MILFYKKFESFNLNDFIIYLKDKENGKKWSLSNNLNDIQTNSYITYGLGFVNFKKIYKMCKKSLYRL